MIATATPSRALTGHWPRLRLGLRLVAAAGVVAALVSAPQWLQPADEYVAGFAVIAILLALSYNLMLGTAGMVSFGHAAFYGIGAFTVALIATKMHGSALVGLAISPLVGALAGALIGAFCLRAVRLYFSLLTLAMSQLLYVVAFQWDTLTGGDNGIHGIPIPDFLIDPNNAYYFVLGIVALGTAVLWVITHSPFGSALTAIRENRQRAAFVGITVKLYELAAFTVASMIASVAGALYAVYDQQAFPGLMYWTESAQPVVMTLIGGMRAFFGPALGAVFYTGWPIECATRRTTGTCSSAGWSCSASWSCPPVSSARQDASGTLLIGWLTWLGRTRRYAQQRNRWRRPPASSRRPPPLRSPLRRRSCSLVPNASPSPPTRCSRCTA